LVVNQNMLLGRSRAEDCLDWCKRVEHCPVDEIPNTPYHGLNWFSDSERLLAVERESPLTFLENCASPEAVEMAARVYENERFDVVLISRLNMAAFADPYLSLPKSSRPYTVLDLDDIESKTHLRIAELHRTAGSSIYRQIHLLEADKHLLREREWLPRFDEVWVCSDIDRAELQTSYARGNVITVPNAVRIPAANETRRSAKPPTLFFIGYLGYFPNDDALRYFHSEILPLIRESYGRPFRFLLAGAGASDSQAPARLSKEPEVEFVGEVQEVAPYYEEADVVIAPIRAGGGTRIKILEAFSFRKPVVATSLAAEGLRVSHDKELLLADSPAEFAQACTTLLQSSALRADLAERAFQRVKAHYSLESLTDLLHRRPALDFRARGT
jgi:glycosyltransferase involved in cell wall biosynthesis